MMRFHRDIVNTSGDEKTFQAPRLPTLSNPFDSRSNHFCKVMTTKGWFNPNGNIQLGCKWLFQTVCASKKSEIALCSHSQHCDRAGHASKWWKNKIVEVMTCEQNTQDMFLLRLYSHQLLQTYIYGDFHIFSGGILHFHSRELHMHSCWGPNVYVWFLPFTLKFHEDIGIKTVLLDINNTNVSRLCWWQDLFLKSSHLLWTLFTKAAFAAGESTDQREPCKRVCLPNKKEHTKKHVPPAHPFWTTPYHLETRHVAYTRFFETMCMLTLLMHTPYTWKILYFFAHRTNGETRAVMTPACQLHGSSFQTRSKL